MPMNSSDFPLVWMNLAQEPGHDHQKDFDAFEANLRRDEPFVILSDTAPPAEEHQHSPEEKKRLALWMKKHKAQLRKQVLAMIQIEPSQAKRLGYKAFAALFAKFWGYPLLLAASREEAVEMARALLSKDGVKRRRRRLFHFPLVSVPIFLWAEGFKNCYPRAALNRSPNRLANWLMATSQSKVALTDLTSTLGSTSHKS